MQKGFTLLEFVLIIAIAGILSVAVISVIVDYKGANIEVAAQKARSDIELARSLAMTKRGTTFGVSFDDSSDEYVVYETNVASPIPDPQTKQNFLEDFSRWSGVTITNGDYVVEFNEFGEPTTGGGGEVRITNGTKTYRITVLANTGKVEVDQLGGGGGGGGGWGCSLLYVKNFAQQ
ncbi:MAG: type II secretion system protein [Pseudomonadota bacterium]